MAEKLYGALSRKDVRAKMRTLLARLRRHRETIMEAKAADDTNSVDYHIENIIKAGGGLWNETIADDYMRWLEAQAA